MAVRPSEGSDLSVAYEWKPIEDLPEDWTELVSSELHDLAAIWKEQGAQVKQSEGRREFNERLAREWSIETGVIERVYTIDRGTTELLIAKGIEAALIPHGATDKPAELVVSIVQDHCAALESLFDFVGGTRDLTTSYIKELHSMLTRHQDTARGITPTGQSVDVPLVHGDWKTQPNNPVRADGTVHEYCPPVHVAREMERLVELHAQHTAAQVPPEVEAAWLHYRFAQIHPFMDGNGRVARALASLVLIRAGWFPLVVNRDARDDYLRALELADQDDLHPLVCLFADIQTRAFNRALSISEDLLREVEPVKELITAAKDTLFARKEARVQEQKSVFAVSQYLEQIAYDRLVEVASTLSSELGEVDEHYYSSAERSGPDTDFWFKMQIVSVAQAFHYYADTRSYRAWVRLKIKEDRVAHLVLSFHSLGVEFVGIVAVSAFLEYLDRDDEGAVTRAEPRPLCGNVFQFSYKEDEGRVRDRFARWLEHVILVGLEEWRRQL